RKTACLFSYLARVRLVAREPDGSAASARAGQFCAQRAGVAQRFDRPLQLGTGDGKAVAQVRMRRLERLTQAAQIAQLEKGTPLAGELAQGPDAPVNHGIGLAPLGEAEHGALRAARNSALEDAKPGRP